MNQKGRTEASSVDAQTLVRAPNVFFRPSFGGFRSLILIPGPLDVLGCSLQSCPSLTLSRVLPWFRTQDFFGGACSIVNMATGVYFFRERLRLS